MSLKSLFLVLTIFFVITDVVAQDASGLPPFSWETINSEEILSVILERKDRSNADQVVLLGVKNLIKAEDAKCIGNSINKILLASDSWVISGEKGSLKESLPYIKAHIGEKHSCDMKNIQHKDYGVASRVIRGMDDALTYIARGAGVLSFYLNLNSLSISEDASILQLKYSPQLPEFKACKRDDAHYNLYCLDDVIDELVSNTTSGCVEYQRAAMFPVYLSTYAMCGCALALGAQYALRHQFPVPPMTVAVEIVEKILTLLKKENKNHIVSLIHYSNFDDVKAALEKVGFEEQSTPKEDEK